MSIELVGVDPETFGGTDPVLAIAEDVFAAMVDGEPGHVVPWPGDAPALTDPTYAWVDVGGALPGRVLVSTERSTATRITRCLLMLTEDEEVGDEDFRDALGEVANVVGGNIKALVPDPGALTLPLVAHARPDTVGDPVHELALSWRGEVVAVGIWLLPA